MRFLKIRLLALLKCEESQQRMFTLLHTSMLRVLQKDNTQRL